MTYGPPDARFLSFESFEVTIVVNRWSDPWTLRRIDLLAGRECRPERPGRKLNCSLAALPRDVYKRVIPDLRMEMFVVREVSRARSPELSAPVLVLIQSMIL